MKTKNRMRHLAWGALVLGASQAQGQSTILGHAGGPGDHLGWNAGTFQALEVRHDGNQPIEWYTDAIKRMQLEPSLFQNIGAFTSLPTDGFLAISPSQNFWINAPKTPFSRLHLAEGKGDNSQDIGYRPWMRNGTSLTGNADQGYLGQKYTYEDPQEHESGERKDYTDMVVQWSDNPGKELKDRMRFIFTSGYETGTPTGAGSLEGLEGMRLYPVNNDEVNVGVGDFFAGNINDPTLVNEPTERLDVVDGRVRIRRLPDDDKTEDEYKIMVVDDTSDPLERGVVKWVYPSAVVQTDCEWTMNPSPAPNHVYTAVGPADPNCPDDVEAVGIGVDMSPGNPAPTSKLAVATDQFINGASVVNTRATTTTTGLDISTSGGSALTRGINISTTQSTGNAANRGISISATGNGTNGTNINYGLRADVTGGSHWTRGVSAETNGGVYTEYAGEFISRGNADYPVGVLGVVYSGHITSSGVEGRAQSEAPNNQGVWGRADVGTDPAHAYTGVLGTALSTDTASVVHGVRGSVPAGGMNWYAMYSQGRQFSTTLGTWTTSDATVKTDIEEYSGGLEKILELVPRSYLYNQANFAFLNLVPERQVGLIAQDLEQVLPELVHNVHRPADYDTLGNVAVPAMDFKAVNYEALIPIIISAIKEQNGSIATQVAENDALVDQVGQLQQRVDEQEARMDMLMAQLAACCTSGMQQEGGGSYRERNASELEGTLIGEERALRIQPNPFNERTTLYYTLERGGRMQLMANSADGKQLRVLNEAQLEAGEYQHEWNTTSLSPGLYYVTLLLDGEPIVKKAVKMDR